MYPGRVSHHAGRRSRFHTATRRRAQAHRDRKPAQAVGGRLADAGEAGGRRAAALAANRARDLRRPAPGRATSWGRESEVLGPAAPLHAADQEDDANDDQQRRQRGLADRAEVVPTADPEDRLEEDEPDQEDHHADEQEGASSSQRVLIAV